MAVKRKQIGSKMLLGSAKLRGRSKKTLLRRPSKLQGTSLTSRRVRELLPVLWRDMQNDEFSLNKLCIWLRSRAELRGCRVPSGIELQDLLLAVCRQQPKRQPLGPRHADPKESLGFTKDLVGYAKVPCKGGHRMAWHCFEACFNLRAVGKSKSFNVERTTKVYKQSYHVHTKRAARISIRPAESDKTSRETVSVPLSILQPEGCKHSWTLVYLHGFSGSGTSYTQLPHYFGIGTVKVVLPTAPLRPVSCYNWCDWYENSQRWLPVKFRRWYDYTADNGGRREDDLDWESLHEARRLIHGIVDAEAQKLGSADRIILGGKSQGCATALDAMLTYPKKLGGFIGVVGHLLSCTPIPPVEASSSAPLYFFHEPTDKIIRNKWSSQGIKKLRSAGHNVRSHTRKDPWGCGHFVGDVEGAWIREALRGITGRSDI